MFNQIIVQGNLTDNIRITNNQNGGITAFGKIGVYNGKDKDGNQKESMFFDVVIFGRDAEIIRDNTAKGSPIAVMGRLEEDRNTADDGRLFINKKIVCTSAKPLLKPVQQQAQPQQYQQAPVQQVYTQPQQPTQYQQPAYNQPQYQQPVYGQDPFAQ